MIFRPAPGSAALPIDSGLSDAQLQQLTELRSNDPRRVKEALRAMGMLDSILVPQVIRLLGSDSVCRSAHAALARNTFRVAGQLSDALLDETLEYSVRRRIPRLLATCDTHRAWDGLFESLNDPHFELRFRCSRGLEAMLQRHPEFRPDAAVIYGIVERELAVSRAAWEGNDVPAGGDEEGPAEQPASGRTSHSLAHVFALLSLVLPREAVRTSFRALHSGDTRLRALALEYLGTSLPREIRDRLSERLEAAPPRKEAARSLSDSTPTTSIRLDEVGRPLPDGKATGATT